MDSFLYLNIEKNIFIFVREMLFRLVGLLPVSIQGSFPPSDTSRHSSCLCSSGRSMLCCAFDRGREEKEGGQRPKKPIGVSPPSRCCSMHHSSYISKAQKQVPRRYESAKFKRDFAWKLYGTIKQHVFFYEISMEISTHVKKTYINVKKGHCRYLIKLCNNL